MKCFNHEDREAVATCQSCGKGLCKECASKYTPCLCDECFAQIQQQAAEQAQASENDWRQTCVYGLIMFLAILWLFHAGGNSMGKDELIIAFCLFFFLPFGWRLLTYFQGNMAFVVLNTGVMFVWLCIKIVLSFVVAIPAFIYQLVKTISAQRKINADKKRG